MIEINERSQGRFCQNHVKEHSSVEIEEEMTTNSSADGYVIVINAKFTLNPSPRQQPAPRHSAPNDLAV